MSPNMLETMVPIWKRLSAGTVPANKDHLTGTVPVNKEHLIGTLYILG